MRVGRTGYRQRREATVELQGILQAQLGAEFEAVVQRHFGDQDFDQHHRSPSIELVDHAADGAVQSRRDADHQAVADRFGDHDHVTLQRIEGAEATLLCLLNALQPSLAVDYELLQRRGHVGSELVPQPNDFEHPVGETRRIEPQQDAFHHFQIAR